MSVSGGGFNWTMDTPNPGKFERLFEDPIEEYLLTSTEDASIVFPTCDVSMCSAALSYLSFLDEALLPETYFFVETDHPPPESLPLLHNSNLSYVDKKNSPPSQSNSKGDTKKRKAAKKPAKYISIRPGPTKERTTSEHKYGKWKNRPKFPKGYKKQPKSPTGSEKRIKQNLS